MIKSLIILVLSVLLCGGAYLSRPNKQDFEKYVRAQLEQKTNNPIARWIANGRIESYIESCTFKDRYLWVTVEQEGQTRFVGAFSHFWAVNQNAVGGGGQTEAPVEQAVATTPPKRERPKPNWD